MDSLSGLNVQQSMCFQGGTSVETPLFPWAPLKDMPCFVLQILVDSLLLIWIVILQLRISLYLKVKVESICIVSQVLTFHHILIEKYWNSILFPPFSLNYFKLCSQKQVMVLFLDFLSYLCTSDQMFTWDLACNSCWDLIIWLSIVTEHVATCYKFFFNIFNSSVTLLWYRLSCVRVE